MALTITDVTRKFTIISTDKSKPGVQLTDPNPAFTVEEVMSHYATIYPELTTATIDGPKMTDNGAEYEFKKTVGTKG